MASLNPIVVTPDPVPSGQEGMIALTFTTSPGTPDQTADIQVYLDGVLAQSATGIVLKGVPAEATPTVTAGSTNNGWEIRTSAGTLASTTTTNEFTIAY